MTTARNQKRTMNGVVRPATERSEKTARPTKTQKREKNSEGLKATWREICHRQKGLMTLMIVLVVMAALLFVFSLSTLRPHNTVVIVGYGDVYGEIAGITGGYRRDSWLNMLAFPILALVFGVLHNLLAVRVYRKYGRDAAMIVVITTMLLILVTVLVMMRLLGEW